MSSIGPGPGTVRRAAIDGQPGRETGELLAFDGQPFVARSEASHKLLAMIQRVARYPHAVLISGETGTGKELVARALHHFSVRCTKPWIDVNCSALPEHLIESELFGYEKGAFSGADAVKAGFFEMAHQGTLFLDEIGDLEPKMQVKLLRVLDGAPYYRLGGNKKVVVDVRIVAATNRDLSAAVAEGTFRKDLFHRLNQIQINVPPLRDRPADTVGIAEFILHQMKPEAHFSAQALDLLQRYPWPGNVRELKNVITRLAVASDDPAQMVEASDLPPEIAGPGQAAVEVPVGDLDNVERLTIQQALTRAKGDQALAADQLGISRRTLSRKLKQYHLDESRTAPLGALSTEQHRYFRANVELRVDLRSTHGHHLSARTANVSSTGMGLVGVTDPFKFVGILDLAAHITEGQPAIVGKGKITWADAQGRAGVRFVSLEPSSQIRLEQWLAAKLDAEGWSKVP